MYEALKTAEEQSQEIFAADLDDDEVEVAAAIYNRLMMLATGAAFTIHQSVADENGLEVWRRLNTRYNRQTPMRGLQLMLKVMVPGKVKKGQDTQTVINKWEG